MAANLPDRLRELLAGRDDLANAANRMMDDVGVCAYSPAADGSGYQALPLHTSLSLELDRALSRAATALRAAAERAT